MCFLLDIYNGNGSESLRPGATPPTERPGTVPKAKPKFDFGGKDINMAMKRIDYE